MAPSLKNYTSGWQQAIFSAFGTNNGMQITAGHDGDTLYYAPTSDQMKLYYTFMNKCYEEGLIHKEVVTLDTDTKRAMEKAGELALAETANTMLTADMFADGQIHMQHTVPLTSEYDSTQTWLDRTPVNLNYGPTLNAESEYIEEMCKMSDVLYATEEVVEGSGLHGTSFVYGLEGAAWNYKDDTYELIVPEGYTVAHSEYRKAYAIWFSGMGRDTSFAGMVTPGNSNAAIRQANYRDYVFPYEDETQAEIWDYLKFTEDEQSVISNKYSAIKTYVEKMAAEFITGVTDIDAGWADYCAEIEAMGISEVLEAYQASYDRFMSNK